MVELMSKQVEVAAQDLRCFQLCSHPRGLGLLVRAQAKISSLDPTTLYRL